MLFFPHFSSSIRRLSTSSNLQKKASLAEVGSYNTAVISKQMQIKGTPHQAKENIGGRSQNELNFSNYDPRNSSAIKR